MNLSTIETRIPLWYENGLSFHLAGPPGIGKTSIVHQSIGRLKDRVSKDIGLIVVNGASLTLPDVIGYGIPNTFTNSAGDEDVEMRFSRPFFSITADNSRWDEYDGGLLFIDEYDKISDLDVKKIIAEAKLSGRLGPHWLPAGWIICTAGNRQEDRAGSTKWFDHDINRTLWIDVVLEFSDWEAWASANGLMPVTIAFAKQNEGGVFSGKVPEKQGPFCTARSLARLDGYFQSIIREVGYIPDEKVSHEEAAGIIGAGMAHQFFGFMRTGAKLPTVEQIIADPSGCEVPSSPDGQMIVCYNLARAVSDNNINPVTTYISRMDGEFSATFYRSACKSHKDMVKNKQFRDWAKANSHLMSTFNTLG